VLGCSGGLLSGRGAGRLGVSTLFIHGPGFLDPAPLAPICGRTELVALPIPVSCQQIFGGVGLRKLMGGGCLQLPVRRCRDRIFTTRLRPLGGIMSPAMVIDLPLEVVPSPVVGYFSGPWLVGEAFLRMSLVGEKTER